MLFARAHTHTEEHGDLTLGGAFRLHVFSQVLAMLLSRVCARAPACVLATKRVQVGAARLLSVQPATSWREAVADKTAALDARMKGSDERIASVQKAMEVNKEAIDKAVGATEKGVKDAVGGIKTDVEKALKLEMGALKAEMHAVEKVVSEKAAAMEKVMSEKAASMEKVMSEKAASMEKVLKAEAARMEKGFKMLERLVYAAMAVFIFGKQIGSGISNVFEAATTSLKAAGEKG